MSTGVTEKSELSRWGPLLRIMAARLVVLMIAMASLVAIVYEQETSQWPFYTFLGTAFVLTILYALWLRSDKTAGVSVPHQFAVDPLIVSGLIYFTGGIDSQLYLLYPLVVLAAGIAVSGRHALSVTVLSILVYTLLTLLLYSGVLLPPGVQVGERTYNGVEVFQDMMFRILMIALVGGGTVYFAGMVFKQKQLLARFGLIANSILDNVVAPLFAVDTEGRIVGANLPAASLMGVDKTTLEGRRFEELFVGPAPSLEQTGDTKKVWRAKRCDGDEVPVFCAASKGTLPLPVGNANDGPLVPVDLYLVTLFDVQHAGDRAEALEIQRRTAATLVNEMAHVVRNPLTAIRGAGELLNQSVDQMFVSSKQLSSEDWEAVKSMCALIFEQSLELDEKVKAFIETVGPGATDVARVLKNADEWSPNPLSSNREANDGENIGCR